MMALFPWLFVAILAVAAGIFLVQYLVCLPLQMNNYLIILVLLVVELIVLELFIFTNEQLIKVSALIVLGLVIGYLAATISFLSSREIRQLSPITRKGTDRVSGHTAVIYFTHGEPPAYDPHPWLETMREFDHDKAQFVPFLIRPFFFSALRREYLLAGGSVHNRIHEYIFRALQESFTEEEKKGMSFHLAYLDSNPRPDEAAIQAINAGADRIILMPVFITISSHTKAAQEMVAALQPEMYGVKLVLAEPLWNSEALRKSFVHRAEFARGETPHSEVGILLVGHGQPKAWDAKYPTQTEQENLFRNGIWELLTWQGYSPEKVLHAWMNFQKPTVAKSMRKLIATGVKKILVFSSSISAASLHSEVDVPKAVLRAKIPPGIEVLNMGAFGDPLDPLLLEGIRKKILLFK